MIKLQNILKVIVDLFIPPSEEITEPVSVYIESNNSEFCSSKIKVFENQFIDIIQKIELKHDQIQFLSYNQLKTYLYEEFDKETAYKFLLDLTELIIFSYFSHPDILYSINVPLNKKEIQSIIEKDNQLNEFSLEAFFK
tara:strand:- start:178 stop:594 length:417 start_codon:yes stop_codon:yes gene_type:complete